MRWVFKTNFSKSDCLGLFSTLLHESFYCLERVNCQRQLSCHIFHLPKFDFSQLRTILTFHLMHFLHQKIMYLLNISYRLKVRVVLNSSTSVSASAHDGISPCNATRCLRFFFKRSHNISSKLTENYMSNNTRQHDTTKDNMSTARDSTRQHKCQTRQYEGNTTQHECKTRQHEYNTRQYEYRIT